MHTLSGASGVAIARLLPHLTSTHVGEAAALVERARQELVLGPSELIAALMFAQPLVKAWPEHWRFAYLIGLDLGMKYLHDGFFIADIREFVVEDFTLAQLKMGESKAFGMVEWSGVHGRFFAFRNALASVAVERPARLPESQYGQLGRSCLLDDDDEDSGVHVLVVTRAEAETDLCEAALTANPEALVSTCSSLQVAVELMKQCYHDGTRVNLLCVDAELLGPAKCTTFESAVLEIIAKSQSFCQQIEPRDVLSNFACKPLVVAISTAVLDMAFPLNAEAESVCDCVMPAHLASTLLRILMDISEV
ncbi:hypothetical protein AB1Y20_008752 [Prymnesium parvum]|uniref:Uncharacterized protein n=1 Tax=Prymnesium parvum TaxID=97485 RepID=A0AB34IS31_PRYPA